MVSTTSAFLSRSRRLLRVTPKPQAIHRPAAGSHDRYTHQSTSTVTNTATGPSVRLTLTDAGQRTARARAAVEAGAETSQRLGDAYVLSLSESRKRNGLR